MSIRFASKVAGAALIAAVAGLSFSSAASAQASVQSQCSDKYQASKTAGTLAGQTWNQFYSKCSTELKAQPAAAATPAAPAAPAAAANPLKPAAAAPAAAVKPATPAAAPAAAAKPSTPVAAAPGAAVFPTAIAPAYASEKPGTARRKTCLDQYNANKTTNSNGGLKYIGKGAYYSQCNTKLKGG